MQSPDLIMKNSRDVMVMSFILLIAVFLLSGCSEISQGLQRQKFEFLYKMNNYSSLFREYTGGITYPGDLDLYQNRMRKMFEDINSMKTVSGYEASLKLKENFLTAIDENMKAADKLKQEKYPEKENIRNDYIIMEMNDRTDNFIKDLNDEISRVGKE